MTNDLYDSDFVRWTEKTAQLLRDFNYEEVDWENVIEEIENLGRSNRNALNSQMRRLLHHLLKWQYQPEKRSSSWRNSIINSRFEIQQLLKGSPSLIPYVVEILEDCYQKAIKLAESDTGIGRKEFPYQCPYSTLQVLDDDFLP